jgi:hypothetical protein
MVAGCKTRKHLPRSDQRTTRRLRHIGNRLNIAQLLVASDRWSLLSDGIDTLSLSLIFIINDFCSSRLWQPTDDYMTQIHVTIDSTTITIMGH